MTYSEIVAVFGGSDGEATRTMYAKLERLGAAGAIAVNVLRAQKTSERAKRYRGGGYKARSYETKQWSLGNLARLLESAAGEAGIEAWGWRRDERQPRHQWVLYVELPGVGQVSYHTDERGVGPSFPRDWDGVRGVGGTRACRYASFLFDPSAREREVVVSGHDAGTELA